MTEQKRSETKRDDERLAAADAVGGEPVERDTRDGAPSARADASAGTRADTRADARGNGTRMAHEAAAIGGSAMGATREVLRGAIGATEDVASGLVGGVTHVATDIVHGVHDIGMEVRDGATGLIGAVGVVGGAAVNTVAHLLADVVGGVRYVVGAALPHNGDGYARQADLSRPDQTETGLGRMPPPGVGAGRESGAAAAR